MNRKFNETGEAKILIVYQKEPHTGQMAFANIRQPETTDERILLAKRMKDEYELPMPVLVDTMEDQSRELLSDLPSPVFVIDEGGIIQAKFPWPEMDLILDAVTQINNKGKWRGPNTGQTERSKIASPK